MLLKRLHSYSQNNLNFPAYNFPDGVVVKNLTVSAGDTGSLPGAGRSPRGENSNPLLYSCLENSMDRAPWWVTVHGVAKSQTQLITHTYGTKKKLGYMFRQRLLRLGNKSIIFI